MTDTTTSSEFTHRQIMTILGGLMMGMFLASLDQTIVSTSIRTIADDLHGLDAQAWVTTAYLITSTITTPLYGKLGDLYGRKKLFIFAITVFVFGSLLCSLATSMYGLAGFRAIQGIGAGGLMSLALAIIGDIVPPRERAKYQGYFLAVFGTSSVLGPVIGGFFAGHETILGLTGWRWVFLVNVPIGLAALFVVSRTLHLPHQRQERRVDWWGASALVLGLVPLLTVAEQGREWGWGSAISISFMVVGVLGIVLFIWSARRMGDDSLIPLRIFRDRVISVTIGASVIVGMAMFGGMMTLPLYMQIVHNATPMASGLMMLPLVGGMMVASIVTGQLISRTGVIRPFPIIGSALLVIGLFLLSTISADTQLSVVMAMMVVVGIGLGNCMQPLTLIVQNAVSPREIGMATASATFFRQMGGTLGVAVFLSLLFSTVADHIASALKAAAATPEFGRAIAGALRDPQLQQDPEAYSVVKGLADPSQGAGALEQVQTDSSVLSRLPDAVAHPFQQGFAESISQVFFIAGCVAVIAVVVLLFLPKVELRTQSAMSARADADAADALSTP
ncbi:MDR family MFS transporter [Demetria terragena]|uniref:MDR family MFS transporter n=1 Tax=Demetria terragena TaxID=63959 RepID=UPI00037022DF|nr:MDR family MFS transporter [Demetria terragena]